MITSTKVQTVLRSSNSAAFFVIDLTLEINTINCAYTRNRTIGTFAGDIA